MRAPALLLAMAVAAPSAGAGGAWDFRVLLDGREIGRHRYTLLERGDGFELRSEARFDVRLFFVSAYRYEHEAVERWQGGCLRALESRTRTNGERVSVTAANAEGVLSVHGPAGRDAHAGCVMSFAYWDPRILAARQLLNSQTGELVCVRVTAEGQETLAVRGERVAVTRHRISGTGLQIDLWYAGERWVALEALTDGGRRLRYELT
jgi:hypothetical protein